MKGHVTSGAILVPIILLTVAQSTEATEPINPKASAATHQVLDYFYALTSRPNKRVVSGQFLDHGTQANLDEVSAVHLKTGHWLGMVGGDYYGRGVTPEVTVPEWEKDADCRIANRLFIDYWNRGGLVTLCLHPINPQSGKSAWMKKNGDMINLIDVLTPGRPGYNQWMRQLDLIATGLQELKDAGVVVLFRPFHEMNGDWFWWGSTNAPEEFVALWRHMVHYMTDIRTLDNLLWVYSPGSGRGDPLRFYPGDEYVDMTGLDAYGKSIDDIHALGYTELTALGKPFGLTEFGPFKHLNYDVEPRSDYDYGQFMRDVEEKLPLCTFFLLWHQFHGLQFQQNARKCLEHPWAVNRADIPPFGRVLSVDRD